MIIINGEKKKKKLRSLPGWKTGDTGGQSGDEPLS